MFFDRALARQKAFIGACGDKGLSFRARAVPSIVLGVICQQFSAIYALVVLLTPALLLSETA
jgi:hypothetical protein